MNRLALLPLLALFPVACASAGSPPAANTAPAAKPPVSRTFALPGAKGAVSLDYLAVDRAHAKAWVPAGDTGNVDVIDLGSGALSIIPGFATVERESHGRMRVLGTSSVTIGEGVAYVGNRATSEICAIDLATQAKGACAKLTSAPDGIEYVGGTKEVWATTPHDSSIVVLSASPGGLTIKRTITLAGSPEGYAIDPTHHLFFTNLEDTDKTVVLDTVTGAIVSTWEAACGGDGPRGLAFDIGRNYVLRACTDGVQVVDGAHGGAILAKAATGAGVDNIDYVESRKELFVASGKDGMLTVFHVGDGGALTTVGTYPTAKGARVVVAHEDGTAVVASPADGSVIVIHRP